MSPVDKIRRWTHQVHVPVIHLPHTLPVRWSQWHISPKSYWIIAFFTGLLALYVFLVLLAYSQGSGSAGTEIEWSEYFWP